MSTLQTNISINSAQTLADTIRPYQLLQTIKWENLLNKKQRDGWIECYVQAYLTTSRSAYTLLKFAAEQAVLLNDETFLPFIDWAQTHAEEEKDHHNWYLDDLLAMGYSSSLVENQIGNDILLEQLGVQFSLIATAHPISILGYVFVLEGYQPEAKTIYELAERFSLPREGFRTILYHLDIDKEHRKPIVELIDRYSPNEFLYGVMLKAAITNLVGWTKFYTKLVQDNNEVAN